MPNDVSGSETVGNLIAKYNTATHKVEWYDTNTNKYTEAAKGNQTKIGPDGTKYVVTEVSSGNDSKKYTITAIKPDGTTSNVGTNVFGVVKVQNTVEEDPGWYIGNIDVGTEPCGKAWCGE